MGLFSHLPEPLQFHDLFALIHHSIIDVIGIAANLLLFLCIILRSPKTLRSYKVLLLFLNMTDFVAALTAFLAMIRIIPGREALGYIYIGPCAYVSGRFCHAVYSVMLTTLCMSMMLMLSSFSYRLIVLIRDTPSSCAVFLFCIGILMFNLLTITSFYFTLNPSEEVKALILKVRPDYDLNSYVFEGHASILWFMPLMTILFVVLPSAPIMVSIFFVRRKREEMQVLRLLVEKSVQMSAKTSQMHAALAKVLSLQSLLPVFFTGAAYCYATCQVDVMCSPLQEHFVVEFVSYMPTISPIITMYFVQPYKKFIVGFFYKENKAKTSTISIK